MDLHLTDLAWNIAVNIWLDHFYKLKKKKSKEQLKKNSNINWVGNHTNILFRKTRPSLSSLLEFSINTFYLILACLLFRNHWLEFTTDTFYLIAFYLFIFFGEELVWVHNQNLLPNWVLSVYILQGATGLSLQPTPLT